MLVAQHQGRSRPSAAAYGAKRSERNAGNRPLPDCSQHFMLACIRATGHGKIASPRCSIFDIVPGRASDALSDAIGCARPYYRTSS
jgi:hypothetical protein